MPRTRLSTAARDPWLVLLAGLGGGLAWAVSVPVAPAALIGVGMWGVGAAVGALTGRDRDASAEEEPFRVRLRPGTEQARLVETLGEYARDLRAFRESSPPSLVDPAIQAVVASDGAQRTALRVAAAVDGLDTALARSRGGPGQGVREAVTRMRERRAALLGRLHTSVDGVAEVYTKLLESAANVTSLDVDGEGLSEIESVNRSLDSFRDSLAALENERAELA